MHRMRFCARVRNGGVLWISKANPCVPQALRRMVDGKTGTGQGELLLEGVIVATNTLHQGQKFGLLPKRRKVRIRFVRTMIGQTKFDRPFDQRDGLVGFPAKCVDTRGTVEGVVKMHHAVSAGGGFVSERFGAFEIALARQDQTFNADELWFTGNHLSGAGRSSRALPKSPVQMAGIGS